MASLRHFYVLHCRTVKGGIATIPGRFSGPVQDTGKPRIRAVGRRSSRKYKNACPKYVVAPCTPLHRGGLSYRSIQAGAPPVGTRSPVGASVPADDVSANAIRAASKSYCAIQPVPRSFEAELDIEPEVATTDLMRRIPA